MNSYKNLYAWQKAFNLTKDVYKLTNLLPKEEKYCLTSQIRKSAISIPSNISEGWSRKNKKEYIYFLYVALGSLNELETQVLLSMDLGYIKDKNYYEPIFSEIIEVRKLISKYLKTLNSVL